MRKYTDLTGQKKGKLTISGRYWDDKKKAHFWRASCECGGSRNRIDIGSWKLGRFISCGCIRIPDIEIGSKFSKWTVLAKDIEGRTRYACKCDCGNSAYVSKTDLIHGKSTGCMACGHKSRKKPPNFQKAFERVLNRYKASAEKRGLTWELDDIFTMLITQQCTYCGIGPATTETAFGAALAYNGIDRVDNTRGYELGNVVPCCWYCNRAKGSMKAQEFEAWLNRIALFKGGKL